MKKLLLLLIVGIVSVSCSSDDSSLANATIETNPLSLLEGNLLTYKDEASFIQEYSQLSKMNSSELQKWIAAKKVTSLLNASSDSLVMQQEKLSDTRIIYSDAIKAILNKESKVKIGDKVLWLNGNDLFLLSGLDEEKSQEELKASTFDLKIYGKVLGRLPKDYGLDKMVSKGVPNANRSKDWVLGYRAYGRDKRLIFTLFNETIVLNGSISSSKMFFRCVKQGRYCSFWKCRWNDDNEPKDISVGFAGNANYDWINNQFNQTYYGITGDFTLLLSTLSLNFSNVYLNYTSGAFVEVKVDGVVRSERLLWY